MNQRERPFPSFTIRSRFVGWVLRYVAAQGADAASLCRRFEVPMDINDDTEVRWDLLRDVSDAAEALLGDPFLGVHLAMVNPRGSYGVMEFSARTAPTVRQCVERVMRYQTLVTDRTRFALRVEGERAIIEHRIVGLPGGCGRHANEFTVALIVRRLRELVFPQLVPQRVWFGHARPERVDLLLQFFGTEHLVFDQEFNGVAFDVALLEEPMPSADAALLAVLDQYAALLVGQTPAAADFAGHVEAEIRRDLMSGTPEIDRVAERMQMSARTLQRRLGESGTSFQELVDGLRHRLALDYLGKMTTPEVAYLLGYSDTRAFLRAFKRWTGGRTPGQYKRSTPAPKDAT